MVRIWRDIWGFVYHCGGSVCYTAGWRIWRVSEGVWGVNVFMLRCWEKKKVRPGRTPTRLIGAVLRNVRWIFGSPTSEEVGHTALNEVGHTASLRSGDVHGSGRSTFRLEAKERPALRLGWFGFQV